MRNLFTVRFLGFVVYNFILYRSSQELSVPEFQWCHSCVPSKILTKE